MEKRDIMSIIEDFRDPERNKADLLILQTLVELGKACNILPADTEFEFDWNLCANTVRYTQWIMDALQKYFDEAGKGDNVYKAYVVTFGFVLYGGYGISYHYNRNKDLSREQLLEAILKPRTIFALDDYVIEDIITKNCNNVKEIKDHIYLVANTILGAMHGHTCIEEFKQQFFYICRACFVYGTILESKTIEINYGH